MFALLFLFSGCEEKKQNIIPITNEEYSNYKELYKSKYKLQVDVNDFDIGQDYVLKKDNLTYILKSSHESAYTPFSSHKREEEMQTPSGILSIYDESLKKEIFSKKLFEQKCGVLHLDVSIFKETFYLTYNGICGNTSLMLNATSIDNTSKKLNAQELVIEKDDARNLNFIETPKALYLSYNTGLNVSLFSISGKDNFNLLRINEDGTLHRYRPIKAKHNIYAESAFIYEKYLYFWVSVPAKKDASYDSASFKKIKLEDI